MGLSEPILFQMLIGCRDGGCWEGQLHILAADQIAIPILPRITNTYIIDF